MQVVLEQVRCFHRAIGAPVATAPELLSLDRDHAEKVATQLREMVLDCRSHTTAGNDLSARLALSLEETAEWIEAHLNRDLIAVADALGDRMYVLLGDAVAGGCPLNEVFDAVHVSNMTKVHGHLDWCGKALKGNEYQPPQLS